MNYSSYRFSLDLRNTRSSVVVKAKRDDTGRKLFITLTDGGVPYHITDDCYAVFTAIKPDGKIVFNDCTIEDCVIIYEMTAQTVAAAGMVESEIIVYGSGGKQLTSASFHILVEDTIYDTETEIESTSEYNALADLIAKVQSLETGVYIGPVQPPQGTLYWLDTSGDGITPAVYTVTNTLTNVARSLVAETVNEGESYSTTLSAEEGYVLSEVSVTMGGVDITAKCYSNGNIYIAFVTGNIVITATAVESAVTTYAITSNLVNVTSNNKAVSAEENASYSATLTAADGYELDAVTVTMGGSDVTSTVYADGVITIPAVTGNVVITATASEAHTGVAVEMVGDSSRSCTVYTDNGQTQLVKAAKANWYSAKTFDKDTMVSYKVVFAAAQYVEVYVTSKLPNDTFTHHYGEVIPGGTPYNVGTEYTGTYLVRAGYQFSVFGMSNANAVSAVEVWE